MMTKFLNETPVLILFAACYIVVDRVMFRNQLSGLIVKGWTERFWRWFWFLRTASPLKPARQNKILDTVACASGTTGSEGAESPEAAPTAAASDSFATENNAVVPPEEYDKVFADGRVEVVSTEKDDEQWENPVSPAEVGEGGGYDYPDDYDELNSAFGREKVKALQKRIKAAVSSSFGADDKPADAGFDKSKYM